MLTNISSTMQGRRANNIFSEKNEKKVDFAILSAMPEELEFYSDYFSSAKSWTKKVNHLEFKVYQYENSRILLGCTGLGTAFASSIITLIHSHFHPEYLFLSGTAGGIHPDLRLCDVVIAENAFEAEIQGIFPAVKNTPFEGCLIHPLKKQPFPDIYSADPELIQTALSLHSGIKCGNVVTSNTFPAPQELFDRIKDRNPWSIDMETSALYQTAWLLGIKALAVRGISNLLNSDGSDDNVDKSDIKGSSEAAAKVVIHLLESLIARSVNSLTDENESKNEASNLVDFFNLKKHPEGGWYARTFQSQDTVKSTDIIRYNNETRYAGTAIYYLLEGNDFSAWHSLKSDEIWHYYKGSPVNIHVIDAAGTLTTYLLGDPVETTGASFQVSVRAGEWFAAELSDKAGYCLAGCTVTPGFEFRDFKMADRHFLSKAFPEHSAIINRLTRPTLSAETATPDEFPAAMTACNSP